MKAGAIHISVALTHCGLGFVVGGVEPLPLGAGEVEFPKPVLLLPPNVLEPKPELEPDPELEPKPVAPPPIIAPLAFNCSIRGS